MSSRVRRLSAELVTWGIAMSAVGYVALVRDYEVPALQIPCRTSHGKVWVFSYPEFGARWAPTELAIGREDDRTTAIGDTPRGSLDCDPTGISRRDLASLENGIVEGITLVNADGEWRFELRDEMRGIYKNVYRFENREIARVRASRRFVGLWVVAAVVLAALNSLAFIFVRHARRRRSGASGGGA